ncbi:MULTISPECIES: caspase family protein [unclassified Novosphingobium]|uniref:caspase family protein n=1 Tax=unclassified Novosphingobium TaxID=2644732 RepID=UPI000EC35B75|nr:MULTISPECIES: caspase family protein [unclassified Novosphingobium]HCF25566.1 peptidase C14 [Novosphingobium sp.]HQV03856.1 caspase family protein [Novosphingobium sp.]
MTAISLHLGLNHVSPSHYGSDQPLLNPVNDAQAMHNLATGLGYQSSMLLDSDATVLGLSTALAQASDVLQPDDTFLLTYAGHGSQMFDQTGDEPDSLDETWCLYDRMILDDELFGLYARFRQGVRVVVVSDSCHSGTVARALSLDDIKALDPEVAYPDPRDPLTEIGLESPLRFRSLSNVFSRSTYLANKQQYDEAKVLSAAVSGMELQCSLLLLAACQDNQLASDGEGNGYFTSWLLHFWNEGAFAGSYTDIFNQLNAAMPRRQKPNLLPLGRDTDALQSRRAFII